MDLLKQNQNGHVLLVYDSSSKDELQDFGKHLPNKTFLSNADLSTEQKPCSCSIILLQVSDKTISDAVAKQLFKLSNPGTTLIVHKLNEQAVDDAEFILKTNGFINVELRNESNVLSVIGKKPNYEIGSTAKLSFKKPAAAVWRLDDDDGVETVDPDNLLDEDDLKKPEPSSLRVCGTTGKRKACKDCSCGLAEELSVDAAKVIDTGNAPKSSCGSCYLGDAFRCASCPYLGMPAFRPGEKIQLKDNLLNDDI